MSDTSGSGNERENVWALLDREESLTRRLSHGYVLALSLVAFLAISGLVIINGVLRSHTTDAVMIDVAGRQRMLSQNISKWSLRIERSVRLDDIARDGRSFAETLMALTSRWREAQDQLARRPNAAFPTSSNPAVVALYAGIDGEHQAIVAAAEGLALEVADGSATLDEVTPLVSTILDHEEAFLEKMEEIVAALTRESSAGVGRIKDVEFGLVVTSIIVLLLEALLIFRPVVGLLTQTQRRLRHALVALAESERAKSGLLSAVPDVVLRVDRGRVLRLVHVPAGVDLAGVIAESEGSTIDAALPRAAARELTARIQQARELEETQRVEILLPGRSRERLFEVRVAIASLDDVLVLLRDITDQRELEREVVDIASSERRRIGHDLHDGLCQHLAGLSLMVGSLAERSRGCTPLPVESAVLAQLDELIEQALQDSRQISRTLHPIALERDGLGAALDELSRSIGALFGVHVEVKLANDGWEPPIATATELYRIAQEAATNAARHSSAETITIQLTRRDDRLLLTVRDDGVGLGRKRRGTSGGMGIRIMEHRAHVIGAWLRIDSAETGTTVTCELHAAAA